jgi:uncharacterized protein YdeI (YjbR/CyaY-like superfamily)
MSRDPRIDAYIARQAEFARPILEHIRAAVHAASPEIGEAIKWGMPHFVFQGKNIASMAAFKAHATLGFWNGRQLDDGFERKDGAMGQFGRLTRIADLPDKEALVALVKKAVALCAQPVPRRPRPKAKPAGKVPEDLRLALDATPAATRAFDCFSPSAKREYIEWVTEAKRPETRTKRIAQAVEWIAEGKKRNWKYETC